MSALRWLIACFLLPAITAGTVAVPARAQDGVPVLEEPVLRSDSAFEPVAWGYKRKDLRFPRPGAGLPVVLTMEGYGGAGVPDAYLRVPDGRLMALRFEFNQGPRRDYAVVHASIRGTECSGGSFYLYDRRHAWDGHAIVEFLGTQPWSNGNVGMIGWSFSGQTAFWTATTKPRHLKAVAPSLLHSDIYRDIFMPGGVQNYLFPVVWYLGTPVGGPHRAPYESLENGNIPNDEICTQHQLSRYSAGDPPNLIRDYIYAAVEGTDNDWYQMHAAAMHAAAIRIPYMQQNNWQDEQTGPRAAVLYHYVNPDPVTITGSDGRPKRVIPKKMLFANGSHGWGDRAANLMWDFFDIFLLGRPDRNDLFADPDGRGVAANTVENLFEVREDGRWTARKTGPSWPFPDTRWTRLYAREGGKLAAAPPRNDEQPDTYVSGAPVRNWPRPDDLGGAPTLPTAVAQGPDAVIYESEPMTRDVAVAGPILFQMFASMAGTDTDFFVALHDVDPRGNVSYLQRGLLKASHRAVDPHRSFYARVAGRRTLVQPYRPHTSPRLVRPGEIIRYDVEIWPLGHIFRKGHRIRVQVHTPPALDGIWGYTATQHQPAAVSIHHSPEHPTNLLLPVVARLERGTAPPWKECRVPGGFPCVAGP